MAGSLIVNGFLMRMSSLTDGLLLPLFQVKDAKLVTICRSLRDGFTPNRVWSQIESNLLLSCALSIA